MIESSNLQENSKLIAAQNALGETLSIDDKVEVEKLLNKQPNKNETCIIPIKTQCHINYALMKDVEFAKKFFENLKSNYFDNQGQKELFNILKEFWTKYKTIPTISVIESAYESLHPASDPSENEKKFHDIMEHNSELELSDIPIISENTSKWIEQIKNKEFAHEFLELTQKGDFEKAKTLRVNFETPNKDTKTKIRILTRKQLKDLPKSKWLIEGIVQENAFGTIYGEFDSCKSFIAIDMGLSICNEKKFLNQFTTTNGKICYIAAEGTSSLDTRLTGWEKHRNDDKITDDSNFALIPDAFDILEEGKIEEVAEMIKGCLRDNIKCIFIDTLARFFGAGDENSTKDMNKFILNASKLQKILNCTVVVIHHTGKDTGKGARGSVALGGACDFMIELSGDSDDKISVKCKKLKDAKRFKQFIVSPEIVDVAENETTLILRYDGEDDGGNKASSTLKKLILASDKEGKSEINYIKETGLAQTTVNRTLKKMVEKLAYLTKHDGLYHLVHAGEIFKGQIMIDG